MAELVNTTNDVTQVSPAPWVAYARDDVRRIGDLLLTAIESSVHSGSAILANIEAAANVLHFMQKAPDTDLLWSNGGDPAHVLDLLQSALGSLLRAQGLAQGADGAPVVDDLPVAALFRAVDLLRDSIEALPNVKRARHQSPADAKMSPVPEPFQAARASSPVQRPELDDLRLHVAHARALAHMLAGIVAESGIDDGRDLNEHTSQTQQAFALLDGLEGNLGRIAQWMEDAEEAGGLRVQGGAA